MKNANLPASPIGNLNVNVVDLDCCGLTKREHFAAMAMQGILSNAGGVIQGNNLSGTGWCNSSAKGLAEWSIECADALLAELEK